MIVCDECRDVTRRAFDCSIVVMKQDAPTGEKGTNSRRLKPPREVVVIPLALCDICVTKVCRNLGIMKYRGVLSGNKKDELDTDTVSDDKSGSEPKTIEDFLMCKSCKTPITPTESTIYRSDSSVGGPYCYTCYQEVSESSIEDD